MKHELHENPQLAHGKRGESHDEHEKYPHLKAKLARRKRPADRDRD